ncbi:MAG TPA: right-handed parallel beta-helix repeat-containing protein [Prolixibacteraceae bacterium]|nr:right-handed parallel beta-helix repeat-containing protein [Prolixibacteraceae bacterium]
MDVLKKLLCLPLLMTQLWVAGSPVAGRFKNVSPCIDSGTEATIPPFAGGTGTKTDPFKLNNAEQLHAMRDYLNSYFILAANINLGAAPWNSGVGWIPVGNVKNPFTGGFDGNGYQIQNLSVQRNDSLYNGLFGRLVDAEIFRVNLTGVNIRGKDFTGALAGDISGGNIMEVNASGTVTGSGEYTGGISGRLSGTVIRNSRSDAVVSGFRFTGGLCGSGSADGCRATGKVTGMASGSQESTAIGGLLGEGYALNSQASGEVKGGSQVGGLIGLGSAVGCFATGNVTATGDYAGGLIGELTSFGNDQGADQEYMPGMTAPLETVAKTKNTTSITGQPVRLSLDDSTRVLVPAFPVPLNITLEKKSLDLSPGDLFAPGSDFRPTGSMRQLTIKGTGDPLAVKPVITIPASEAGTVNPETINAVRVGSLYINGVLVENHTAFLPVTLDKNGNYKFVDALFPDGVTPDKLKSATAGSENQSSASGVDQVSETAWVGNVQYFLMTFDKSLNWIKRPVLERMVPDSTLTTEGFRKPWRRTSPAEREKVSKQPVCNVVILVHGHNEEESDGYLAGKIVSPWEFNYKRVVWDLLYEKISKNKDKDFPSACTAMYEFISPTYRPVFSPVGSVSGFHHQTLGEDLGNMINEELEGNAQIQAMMKDNIPFNLFLVAHSQGGLVARAGLRFVKPEILKRLKLVVTWGSPHSGAALYSLRYALTVGHDLVIDGIRLPMQNIGQSDAYQSGVSGIALDAPGIRDLRWDASKADMLRFGELFRENATTISEIKDTELPNGKLFFSDNLDLFNKSEGSFSGDLLKDKFKFYEGTTTKNALLQTSWDVFSFRKFYHFAVNASGIEKGAQLNKLAMKAAWNASDGAVPVYSQRGEGIWPAGNIQRRNMGDTDHEEFYGGEDPNRTYFPLTRGREVAWQTFVDMDFPGESRRCPNLDLDSKVVGDTVVIFGTLVYPQIKKANGGDDFPGKRISMMGAQRDNEKGTALSQLVFKWKDDGTFEGKGKKTEVPDDTLFITASLKTGSLVVGTLEPKIENKVFNLSKKLWYTAIQKAVDEAGTKDTIVVYPGTYAEYVRITLKDITLQSKSGPDGTILDGKDGTGIYIVNGDPVIKDLTINGFYNGIYVWEANSGKTLKPIITGNKITNSSSNGIYLTGKTAPTIQSNIIDKNTYYGIRFDDYNTVTGDAIPLISKNTINGHNRGICVGGVIHAVVQDNIISNNDYGIEILKNATVSVLGNTISGNMDDGLRFYLCKKGSEVRNNIIKDGGTGIGINGAGSYQITGNTISKNRNGIYLGMESSGPSSVLISANSISGSITEYAEGGSGIVVQGPGRISIMNNNITGNTAANSGGGMNISASDTVEISGNTISGNTAAYYGGGIILNCTGLVIISKNTIANNSVGTYGGGIMIQPGTKANITGNEIKSNAAGDSGGGIWGTAQGWAKTEVVTVSGKPQTVPRYVPCFTETTNTYSGNSNGKKQGAWGPGIDKWCADSGFDVYP